MSESDDLIDRTAIDAWRAGLGERLRGVRERWLDASPEKVWGEPVPACGYVLRIDVRGLLRGVARLDFLLRRAELARDSYRAVVVAFLRVTDECDAPTRRQAQAIVDTREHARRALRHWSSPDDERKEFTMTCLDPRVHARESVVRFYADGDRFATVTTATDADAFLEECAAALDGALLPFVHTHRTDDGREVVSSDMAFQIAGLLPQICEIWAKLRGYKADRVFEQRVLIAGAPDPAAHMQLMNDPLRPTANGHASAEKLPVG